MQTDAWVTETPYPDRCPLCNRPLANGSNICLSCGFTAHESAQSSMPQARPLSSRRANPLTPIPARASARRAQSSPGGASRHVALSQPANQIFARQAEQQTRGRLHESPNYEAASSLSALSLIISETPTAPPRARRQAERLDHIDEIDTLPQLADRAQAIQQSPGQEPDIAEASTLPSAVSLHSADIETPNPALTLSETTSPAPFHYIDEIDTLPVRHIGEIDTVPEAHKSFLNALPRGNSMVSVNAASWTAGHSLAGRSLAAQFVASRFPRRRQSFSPLDRTRWWLLRPGHIEFFLWVIGSLLLFGITFVILLATILSMMLPGPSVSGNLPTSTITPGAATVIANNPGTQNTPVLSWPTPSSSPTPGATITSTLPVGTAASSQGSSGASSSVGNSLNKDDSNSFFARLAHLNPLVWVIGACYIASMLLLGLAGVLRRRRS